MSNETIQFTRNGKNYEVHTNGYSETDPGNACFPVQVCPKCNEINSTYASVCSKCNGELHDIEPVLAKRTLRSGRMILIAGAMWGVINGLLLGGKVHLGALPTILILGGCYFIAGKCCGTKMEVDDQATEDYRAYCKVKQEEEKLEQRLKDEGVTF